MVFYVPGTNERDPEKQNMSLQALGGGLSTATTNISTNTTDIATANSNIATNTTNIATNTTAIATNTTNITTLQTPPLFKVALNTQQSVTTSTFTTVHFDTVTYDTNSWWDAVNFAYKPQRAGYYRFSWSIYGGQSTSPTRTLSRLRLNVSTDVSNGSDAPTSVGIANSVGADIIHLNGSTDNISVVAFITATTPVVGFTGSPFLCVFSGEFFST